MLLQFLFMQEAKREMRHNGRETDVDYFPYFIYFEEFLGGVPAMGKTMVSWFQNHENHEIGYQQKNTRNHGFNHPPQNFSIGGCNQLLELVVVKWVKSKKSHQKNLLFWYCFYWSL